MGYKTAWSCFKGECGKCRVVLTELEESRKDGIIEDELWKRINLVVISG